MTRRTNHLGDDLYRYLLDVSLRELDVLRRLREETAALPDSNMQIGPEQGQFMSLLVEIVNVDLAGTDLRREVSDRGILTPGQTRPAQSGLSHP